ncbi:MAG: arginine deiminase family protein [Nannocystaceae bacterium]
MEREATLQIDLCNEIGRLRDVVVHRPGAEIARMTQHHLDLLLFDDILSPREAELEHALMTNILEGAGARVYELLDLLTRALERAPVVERRELLARVCAVEGVLQLEEPLFEWAAAPLAAGLVAGIYWSDLPGAPASLSRLRSNLYDPFAVALNPLPNLMFMRDPCVAVGRQLVVCSMARAARAREPLLVRFALRWGLPSGFGPAITALVDERERSQHRVTLEGGDVLVPSCEFVLIGCSERSSPQGIERFAHDVLFPNLPQLARVYAVLMPAKRSLMHLDTILTQIDRALFLGHGPLVAGPRALPVARLERERPPALVDGASVLDVLRDELGPEVALVPCGGEEPVQQEREQWTDGANAVCVAPGRIVLYSRNTATIAALRDHGFAERRLSVVHSPEQRAELIADGMQRPRAVFSFSGSELSRARGGGRCLTMPLRRDPIDV